MSGVANRSALKDKDELYRCIISQLLYDGHHDQALSLIQVIMPNPECPPSGRLLSVFQKGLHAESAEKAEQVCLLILNENKGVFNNELFLK